MPSNHSPSHYIMSFMCLEWYPTLLKLLKPPKRESRHPRVCVFSRAVAKLGCFMINASQTFCDRLYTFNHICRPIYSFLSSIYVSYAMFANVKDDVLTFVYAQSTVALKTLFIISIIPIHVIIVLWHYFYPCQA